LLPDIIARFKRLKDSMSSPNGITTVFGLLREQYAIQTGQHPAYYMTKYWPRSTGNLKKYRLLLLKLEQRARAF